LVERLPQSPRRQWRMRTIDDRQWALSDDLAAAGQPNLAECLSNCCLVEFDSLRGQSQLRRADGGCGVLRLMLSQQLDPEFSIDPFRRL